MTFERIADLRHAGRPAAAMLLALLLAGFAASCGDDKSSNPGDSGWSFVLEDVNPSSVTYGERLAIETFRGKAVVVLVGEGG
ncbi:MAG: hypothetical protein ACE15D_15520 [Candidatus Eisenbacteria bacterium]|nr:hypothetical protein [Candidatus Eisenbacteria bacterium]